MTTAAHSDIVITSARAITAHNRKGERFTMAKKTAAPVDDDDVEDAEIVEDEDDETPAKGKKVEDEVWGVRALIALVKEKTGKEYKPREVRTQLRAMAKAGTIDREIIPGNKSRYSWSGPDDPEVKAFIKAAKGGAIEENKKAALDKLKSDKAKKDAAKGKSEPAKGKGKKTAPPADDDEDDD